MVDVNDILSMNPVCGDRLQEVINSISDLDVRLSQVVSLGHSMSGSDNGGQQPAAKKRGLDAEDGATDGDLGNQGMPSWFKLWSSMQSNDMNLRFGSLDASITTVRLLAQNTRTSLDTLRSDVDNKLGAVKLEQEAQAAKLKDLESKVSSNVQARLSYEASSVGSSTKASEGDRREKGEMQNTLVFKGWQFNAERSQRSADLDHFRNMMLASGQDWLISLCNTNFQDENIIYGSFRRSYVKVVMPHRVKAFAFMKWYNSLSTPIEEQTRKPTTANMERHFVEGTKLVVGPDKHAQVMRVVLDADQGETMKAGALASMQRILAADDFPGLRKPDCARQFRLWSRSKDGDDWVIGVATKNDDQRLAKVDWREDNIAKILGTDLDGAKTAV